MIRVLNVLSALDGGGVESMLFNYYKNMDRSVMRFDFVVHNTNEGMLEAPLSKMGSGIYHVTPKRTSLLKNIIDIDAIIKNGNYDIVQCHQNFSSFPTLICARLRGVKVRVVHSHGNNPAKSFPAKIRNYIFRRLNQIGANFFFACGMGAGKWLFGDRWTIENYHNKIINNAIDTKKFSYNPLLRKQLRKEYKLSSEVVLLHIGRFSAEKNHKFIIELFEKLQNRKPNKYVLFLAGSGGLEQEIKDIVQAKNLSGNIHFLGNRKDIPELLNMADIFLLPSIHEGFPVTLIEAQSTGIRVLASSNVTTETKLTDRISYLTTDDSQDWIKAIEEYIVNSRKGYDEKVRDKRFDIVDESVRYQDYLISMSKEHTKR